jgi:hypothetical protein
MEKTCDLSALGPTHWMVSLAFRKFDLRLRSVASIRIWVIECDETRTPFLCCVPTTLQYFWIVITLQSLSFFARILTFWLQASPHFSYPLSHCILHEVRLFVMISDQAQCSSQFYPIPRIQSVTLNLEPIVSYLFLINLFLLASECNWAIMQVKIN